MRLSFVTVVVAGAAATFLTLTITGCGSADKAPVMSPTPIAPGYPQASFSPPPAPPADAMEGVNTATAERSVVHAEPQAKTRGGGGDKDDAKKVAMMQPPAPGQPQPQPQPQQPPLAQPQAVPPGTTPVVKADPTSEPAQNRDLVIYSARFSLAVYQVDQGLSAVEKIANDNGGYLGQKKDREITIRIPRGRFQTTLVAIDKIGDVLHRDIQAQDVTDEHVDLEIRIKNARAMQRRLSDLLTKASVKDALEIEKELHRVTEELERLEGRMKVLKDKVAFSTVTVVFEPRGTTIQTARVRLPFPWLGGLNLPSLLSLSEDK